MTDDRQMEKAEGEGMTGNDERQAILALIVKRGWQLWLADFGARLKSEKWFRRDEIPSIEEWERYRSGMSPAEHIEEIRNSVWMA